MRGLWHLPTRPIDPGLGLPVFDFLVALTVICFTFVAIALRPRRWPEAQMLHIGMVLLSFWSTLQWIDVIIRHNRIQVSYSYILVGCVYSIFRVLSDIFVLCGTMNVLPRYSTMETHKFKITLSYVYGWFFFLGIYHLCLLFALSFAWLSFSGLEAINAIAKARNGFEITFTTFQFIATFGILAKAFEKRAESLRDVYSNELRFLRVASIALLLRSFCEVIIVGQLDRYPVNIQKIHRARDVTYGLFSMAFVFSMAYALPLKDAEDPLAKEKEDFDQAEQAATRAAVEEVRTDIMTRLNAATEGGKKTAPTISSLLDTLEGQLRPPQNPSVTDPYGVYRTKKNEIDSLRKYYDGWEPIYKWPGREPTSQRTAAEASSSR